MRLTFILGPAGSGKTTYCLEKIGEELRRSPEGPPLVFLVPEQMTFQVEKAVLKIVPGFMRLHVLSFRRLAWRVLEETGGGKSAFITETGKAMAVQAILNRRREDLRFFKPVSVVPGLPRAMARTLHELVVWNVSPQDIQRASETVSSGAGSLLALKLKDIALVYHEYLRFIQGRFTDPDDYLAMAAQKLPRCSLVKGARVWIDGFSGFTPREYDVLRSLLQVSTEVNVALCMDPVELLRPPDETRIFYATRRVFEKMREMALEAGATAVGAVGLPRGGTLPEISDTTPGTGSHSPDEFIRSMDSGRLGETLPRFRASDELGRLEAWLRARDYPPVGFTGDARVEERQGCPDTGVTSDDIILVRASSPGTEVEACAREILRLVRDEGYRFADISVELRDLRGGAGIPYADIIRTVFGDYGIPFFIDDRRPVTHHPLVELVRSALDVVVSAWSSDAVLSYLKNDLVGIRRGEVDAIENFVLARGIRGTSWLSDTGWDHLTPAKNRAVRELREFWEKVMAADGALTAGFLSSAVFELLRDLDVKRTLEGWRREALEAGAPEEAMYHSGAWGGVVGVLSEAYEILGEQVVSPEDYSSVLSAGLEDIRVGLIPPAVDQVQVSSLERSRQPGPRATFLLGAFQGFLPRRHEDDLVLSDRERDELHTAGIELDAPSRSRQFFERYLCYIALTRPSRRLWVSYPAGDMEGRAIAPSSLVAELRRLFPSKVERYEGPDPPGEPHRDLDWVVPCRALGTLARQLSGVREGRSCGRVWIEVYRWFMSGSCKDRAARVLKALGYSNNPGKLSKETAARLYGNPLLSSVSRLERYSRCPFYHFAADGLGLEEREVFVLEPATAGTLLHLALKEIVDLAGAKDLDWAELGPERVSSLAQEAFSRVLKSPEVEIFRSSPRYRYVSDVLQRAFVKAAAGIVEHVRRGAFRPAAAELRFGFGEGPPALEIPVGGGVTLKVRGIVDRVDLAGDEAALYVRVVDYKSGGAGLDLEDVIHGLSLQLPLYLLAVTRWLDDSDVSSVETEEGKTAAERRQAIPAGTFYFRVLTPVVRRGGPSRVAGEELERFRMRGLVSDSPRILDLMEFEREPGSSAILPLRYLKSGGVKGSLLSDDDMRALLKLVEEKVQELGRGIMEGDISIAPYRRGTERACKHCPYGPVCTFDILVPGNTYRNLRRVGREKVLDLIRRPGRPRRDG